MKTRFCPSPTGHLHLGNMRTALFNALFSKKMNATFLLRIEDTDKARSSNEFTESLIQDLHWLSLSWDEGPEVEGQLGPYFQSQRQAIYDHYYQQLEEKELVYPCFCSEETLVITRKLQLSRSQPPRYPGTCCALSKEKILELRSQKIPESLRFKIPKGEWIEFTDLVKGPQKFKSDDIGDFIIRRHDGTPPFMFCNAIDDACMQVTHALRGEDHLTNTPKQLLILRALGLVPPQYGHVSLILGRDGSPLSKRNGSRSIKELREEGFLPIAIINYLSRLGHYYENPHFMELEKLTEFFSLKALSVSPARFDLDHLLHWQREAIAHASLDVLGAWCHKKIENLVPKKQITDFIMAIKGNILFPQEAEQWAYIIFDDQLILNEEEKQILQAAGKLFFQEALTLLPSHKENFKSLSEALSQKTKKKGKELFLPLRILLTGKKHGPDMMSLCHLLGESRMRKRIEAACELC